MFLRFAAVWGLRLAWLALGLTLSGAAAAQDLLSLFRLAIVRDADYLAAQAAAQAGREQLPQARAALLPQLSASVSYTQNDTDQATKDVFGRDVRRAYEYTGKNAAVSVRQMLFRPAALAQLEQAEARVRGIDAQLEKEFQSLALRLAQAYFEVLLAREKIAAAESEARAYASQLKAAEESFKAGAGSRTDIEEARARLDLAQARQIEAEQRLIVAQRALMAIVGERIDAKALAMLSADAETLLQPLTPAALESWLEAAEANNPEIRSLQTAVEAAERELSKARAGHLPTLDFVASRTLTDSDSENIIGNRYLTTRYGLQLNIPLYAGGYVDSTVRQALSNLESARQQLEAARRRLATQVTKSFAAVTQGGARIAALEQAARSAAQAVVAAEKGMLAGIRQRNDLLNALAQQASTRFELFQAKVDYLLGRLTLLQLTGRLDEAEIARVNGLLRHLAESSSSG
jgi:protease secretion system outer membrane protein